MIVKAYNAYLACSLIAFVIVAVPTVAGYEETSSHFRVQRMGAQDDGRRYVIGNGSGIYGAIAIVLDSLEMALRAETIAGEGIADIEIQVRQVLESQRSAEVDLRVSGVQPARQSFRALQSPVILLLDAPAGPLPILVINKDDALIRAIEPGNKKVLYRRAAVISEWSGISIQLPGITTEVGG